MDTTLNKLRNILVNRDMNNLKDINLIIHIAKNVL
jgi:hypothetical protein